MSTVSSNLYPPIVLDALPAFVGGMNAECKIYFSLSKYNSYSNIQNVQISLINQRTNATVLQSSTGIILANIAIDETETGDYRYYTVINSNQLINSSFKTNEYYKIQLRFTSINAEKIATGNAPADWLEKNKNSFSEWSKICLIKSISEPKLVLKNFELADENQEIILTSQLTAVVGSLQNLDENQYLRSYNIKLYDLNSNNLLVDSGNIFTNEYKPNEFNYQLGEELLDGITYKLSLSYVTNNSYSRTHSYTFRTIQRGLEQIKGVIFASADNLNGKIKISLTLNDTGQYLRNVTIRRTSSKSNFHKWEDIYTISSTNNSNNFIWQDNTVESGVFYKYCAQQRNSNGDRGVIKPENITQPTMVIFDDMFLITKDAQLKIQFNPTVTDFKYNVTESQQIAIGSKYPYVKRNSNNYYRTFQIGGLISSFTDETGWYDPHYYNNQGFRDDLNELTNFTSKKEIYGDSQSLYRDYNNTYNISEYEDYNYEKEFRQKVYDFLYTNNVKLFKSATEGNILIKLMNISFQPIGTLGRRLYSFTATAVEIDEANVFNYDKYNIIKIGTYDTNIYNKLTFLGQLQGQYDNKKDIVQQILKEKYLNKSKFGYINLIKNLTFLRIEITSPPYPIVDNGGSLVKFSNEQVSSQKLPIGYIIEINGTEMIIPAFQHMVKKTITDSNNNQVVTTVPERWGYFELNAEDISVQNLRFKYPHQATIDYICSVLEKEDTSKIPSKTAYFYNPGQLYGIFNPGELLINKIAKKYFLNNRSNFQKLLSVDGIRLEGPIGSVAYVKDSRDSDYTRHVLQNGYLQLMEDDIFINEIYFEGIHLTTEVNKDWYIKSSIFTGEPFDEDPNIYNGFPNNPQLNTIYHIKRTKEVQAVLYNEWFENNNTLKMLENYPQMSYEKNDANYSLFLDSTLQVFDENPIQMLYIYGSWYSLSFYESNKEKFTQLLDSDIRYIRENEYIIIGKVNSLNQVTNPKNHEVYIIQIQNQSYKWIYHNNQWYPFTDNNDIICPIDGVMDYFYELARGEYNNEI